MKIITDKNWRNETKESGILKRVIKFGSPEAIEHGMIPYGTHTDLDVLIPWDEMKERINLANERKQMPIHHLRKAGAVARSQGRTNYCWSYGLGMTIEAIRIMEAQPYKRLGPASLGWAVRWRNAGNYLSSAMKAAIERGMASSDFVPDGTTDPDDFKDGWIDDALNYKPIEFTDCDRGLGEKAMAQHCVSLLVAGIPIYDAFDWWGHALSRMGVVWDESCLYNLRWIDWNSHGDGEIEMEGRRGIPDEAYGLRVSTYSPEPSIVDDKPIGSAS